MGKKGYHTIPRTLLERSTFLAKVLTLIPESNMQKIPTGWAG